jgi:hypothetical protein
MQDFLVDKKDKLKKLFLFIIVVGMLLNFKLSA